MTLHPRNAELPSDSFSWEHSTVALKCIIRSSALRCRLLLPTTSFKPCRARREGALASLRKLSSSPHNVSCVRRGLYSPYPCRSPSPRSHISSYGSRIPRVSVIDFLLFTCAGRLLQSVSASSWNNYHPILHAWRTGDQMTFHANDIMTIRVPPHDQLTIHDLQGDYHQHHLISLTD